MIVINLFSVVDLVAAIVSTHVLLVFFYRSVRVTRRTIDLLFTAVMFFVWLVAVIVLASDNVVPAGVPADSIPNAAERLKLWEKAIPETYSLAANANLRMIADRFEVAGGSIMNVVRHCALRAAVRGRPVIEEADLLEGIKREYKKSGRIMN